MTSPATRSTTAECLKDFFQRYEWEAVQPFMADYVGVEKSTVRRWYNGKLPVGAEMLKVRVMLVLLGYSVEEFNALALPARQFAQAIALGLISPEDAQEMVGYENLQSLFALLLRAQKPVQYRWHRLERFVSHSMKELEEAVANFRHKLDELPLEQGFGPVSMQTSSDPVPPAPVPPLAPAPSVTQPPTETPEPPTTSDLVVN